MFNLYVLVDPRDGTIRYVGITCKALNKRLAAHISEAKRKRTDHRTKWIGSLLDAGVRPEMVLLDNSFTSYEELIQGEISTIQRMKQDGYNLVNGTDGGQGAIGRIASRETREKLAIASTGRKPVFTDETRRKISEALTGRVFSEETRQRMSDGQKRKDPISDATRKKMSESRKGIRFTPEHRAAMSESFKRRPPPSEEMKEQISATLTGRRMPEETKIKISGTLKGVRIPEDQRRKMVEASRNAQRKMLTSEERTELCALYKTGTITQRCLAEMYGINRATARRIIHNPNIRGN